MNKDRKVTGEFLHRRYGFTIQQSHDIMRRFGKHVGINPPDFDKHTHDEDMDLHYDAVCSEIQKDWEEFMNFFGNVKRDYKKPRIKQGKARVWRFKPTYIQSIKNQDAHDT